MQRVCIVGAVMGDDCAHRLHDYDKVDGAHAVRYHQFLCFSGALSRLTENLGERRQSTTEILAFESETYRR